MKKFYLFALIGLIIRLFLALLPGFEFDINAWFAWAIRLYDLGFAKFYSNEVWTNYTPGYLYILYFLGWLNDLFNLSSIQFLYLLKLPAIFTDIILGYFVYKIILSRFSQRLALVASCFIIFNPAFIFNSSIWGQIDSILSILILYSILLLDLDKISLSSSLFGIAFLVKPQAISLIPIFFGFLLRNNFLKNITYIFLPALFIIYILSLAFFVSDFILGIPKLFLKMFGDYSYNSLFAYNFWGIFGFWIEDSKTFLYLSYQVWGILFFTSYLFFSIFLYFKKKLDLFSFACLVLLAFYFLPTRVHERYLLPALPMLILTAFYLKSNSLKIITAAVSAIHSLNLYFVYVYYNEVFQNGVVFNNKDKLLYSYLYPILEKNGNFLSLVSFILFILITYIIVKLNYAKK